MVFLLQLTFKCSRDRGRCGRVRARLMRARWSSVQSRASGTDTGGAGSTKEDFERRVAELVALSPSTHPPSKGGREEFESRSKVRSWCQGSAVPAAERRRFSVRELELKTEISIRFWSPSV